MSPRTPFARLANTAWTVSTAIPIVVAFAGCLVEHSHAGPPGGDGDTPPNLVVVFVDDLGYGDLGCYGGEIAPTPRLDALAAEGLRATDFSVAQPVCSASRAALLTGRYPHRIGIVGALGPGADRGLDDEVITLAELCRDRGYATALYGKWHLGDREPFLPTQHGFDEWWGIPYSNDMWPRHPESPQHYPPLPLREGDADGERLIETNPDQRRFTTEIADRGADFIRRSVAADRPFLLYLPHPMPHVPLFTSKAGEGRGGNGLYSDVVAEIDASVGTILDTLDETGVAENTFVVFASDNGPWLSYGDRAGTTGPLREGKGTTFEGGVRVPWIARWPGRFPEGETIDAPFNAIDMLPTFADAIGAAAPFEVEGRSVLASLENPEGIPLDRGPILYWYHAPGGGQEVQAVRDGRWKLHLPHRYRSMEGREVGSGGRPGAYDYGRRIGLELFDLESDVGESIDVSAVHPEVVEHLQAIARRERARDVAAGGTTWLGPHWQPNRLQDWRRTAAAIECVNARDAVRTAHRLDVEIDPSLVPGPGPIGFVEVSIRPRPASGGGTATLGDLAFAGMLLGAGGPAIDPRLTALVQQSPGPDGGLIVAVDGRGRLHALDFSQDRGGGFRWTLPNDAGLATLPSLATSDESDVSDRRWTSTESVRLRIELVRDPDGDEAEDRFTLKATLQDEGGTRPGSVLILEGLDAAAIDGGLALVSHRSPNGFAFADFDAAGPGIASEPQRRDAPLLATMYTLDRSESRDAAARRGHDLRLTAQFQTVPADTVVECRLEVARAGGRFETVAEATLDPTSYTATFEVPGVMVPRGGGLRYRVAGLLAEPDGTFRPFAREGRLRGEPVGRPARLASLGCVKHWTGGESWNHDGIWYPHADLAESVAAFDPDLMFFSGDQLYEGDLTGADRHPLDYHTKWQRFLRSFGDLLRDRPAVLVTDDHDVYHGNLWGSGGLEARARDGLSAQDAGGYRRPIEWVNMVHRTQTSHLPPTVLDGPIGAGVEPYTTRLVWGPFDMAILADRMWKDSASVKVPAGAVKNGFFTAQGFDPRDAAVEDASLLGAAQEAFLAEWAEDPRPDAPRRLVMSQSPFVAVHTLPRGRTDAVVPSLDVLDLDRGEWPEDDMPVADADTHGWPQPARTRAVRMIADADALHLAGDQHLATLVQYGLEVFRDGPWVLTAPAIANTWPRRWMPREAGEDPLPGMPRGGGDFEDAFGNPMTVWRVANPTRRGIAPERLHDLSPGFATVEFDPDSGETRVAARPRLLGQPPYFGFTLPE